MKRAKPQPQSQGAKPIPSSQHPRKQSAPRFPRDQEPPRTLREFLASPFWPKLLDTLRLGASLQTAEARCRLRSGQLRIWMQAKGAIGELFRTSVREATADSSVIAEHSIRDRNPEKWLQRVGSTVSTAWSEQVDTPESPVLSNTAPSQLSLADALLELQKAGVISFTPPVPTVPAITVEEVRP